MKAPDDDIDQHADFPGFGFHELNETTGISDARRTDLESVGGAPSTEPALSELPPFRLPPVGRAPAPIPQAPLLPSQQPWPDPRPLRDETQREPYPIDALPDVVRAAVEDVQELTQAPMAMVATSALVMMSIAAQARIDVARDSRLFGPVGLYALTLAESGERKSTVDGHFTRALERYEKDQARKMRGPLRKYAAEMEAWEAGRQGIKANIRALAKDNASTETEEQRLLAHDERRPVKPRVPRLRLDDATPEGLGDKFVNGWPVAAILSDEGGTILGGYGMGRDSIMRSFSALNKAWDGRSVSATRKVAESLPSISVRAAMHLQVQPRVMLEFYQRAGELARGSGLFARFLMCCPESTQGTRQYKEPRHGSEQLDEFDRRMYAALDSDVELEDDGGCSPPLMTLSAEAKELWRVFHDEIEAQLAAGGALGDVRESANKIADNAARVAAVFEFHVRHCVSDPIGAENMEAAIRIVRWHLHEARRFFGEVSVPEEHSSAVRMDEWIERELRSCGDDRVRSNDLLRRGPVRKKPARDECLQHLEDLDRVRMDGSSGTVYVLRNPKLLVDS